MELTELPEGTRLLVTLLLDDEAEFWLQTSQTSLDTVWDNAEDEVVLPKMLGCNNSARENHSACL